jgi:RNA 3'-terminal phosphate cyclase
MFLFELKQKQQTLKQHCKLLKRLGEISEARKIGLRRGEEINYYPQSVLL